MDRWRELPDPNAWGVTPETAWLLTHWRSHRFGDMAMIIAWQTINAVRRPGSKRFTRGFLVVTPGVTIRDRLRVLQPNDPDS